jgi:tetratricopeptide (TPR) repeat protein
MQRPRLYINHTAKRDVLIALEFGRVDEDQPPENWRDVSERFSYLHESPGGRVLGFGVLEFSGFDSEDREVAEIWDAPLFDAPLLGLTGASAGEILVSTRAILGESSTLNKEYFDAAVGEQDPGKALPLWLACLESGDFMAHFGLGYTLYDLGRHEEALRHLRYYTEIAPHGSWNWFWYGKAAAALGQEEEAISAYERALVLEADGGEATEAEDRLKELIDFEEMTRIRERLNDQTGGKIGLYSTAEHYSTGPSAKVLSYYQYDDKAELKCPVCGWQGTGADADKNIFEELFDIRCPRCETMLLVVGWPTLDEIRQEASRGNEEAELELERIEGGPGTKA